MNVVHEEKALDDLIAFQKYVYWLQFHPDIRSDVQFACVICPVTRVGYATVALADTKDFKIIFAQARWSLGTLVLMTPIGRSFTGGLTDEAKDLVVRSALYCTPTAVVATKE